MKLPGRGLVLFAGVCAVTLGLAWTALFGFHAGAVSAVGSNSMSHAEHDTTGPLDPGEWMSFEPVEAREDIVTFYEGRRQGHRYAGDWGDVITYRPVAEDGAHDDTRVAHRAIAWVAYDPASDAYDIPELELTGVREFVLPSVGSWEAESGMYLHRSISVRLDPETAGRHDGFLTKGDHNEGPDQHADGGLAGMGRVELVDLQHVTGKVVHHVESYVITGMIFTVPVGALVASLGWYGVRAFGGPRAMLRQSAKGPRCGQCTARLADADPFCLRCGGIR